MTWKHSIWIAYKLALWVVPAVLLIAFWADANKETKARNLNSGRIEFSPNKRASWVWPLLVIFLIYAATVQVKHSHWNLLDLVGTLGFIIVAVMIIPPFPATLVVTTDGLEQVSWLWKNKHILWTDIVEINTGEKSPTVTITGADGTKIVHSRMLADRPRLLLELERHCGENLPPDFPRESITGIK